MAFPQQQYQINTLLSLKFQPELFKLQGAQLKMRTSYHPQIGIQTKVVNNYLETYLCCFTPEMQHQWVQWFPLEECLYNTTYHGATKLPPYEDFYGQQPPSITSYLSGTSKVQEVENLIQTHEWTLAPLKSNLALVTHLNQSQQKHITHLPNMEQIITNFFIAQLENSLATINFRR